MSVALSASTLSRSRWKWGFHVYVNLGAGQSHLTLTGFIDGNYHYLPPPPMPSSLGGMPHLGGCKSVRLDSLLQCPSHSLAA